MPCHNEVAVFLPVDEGNREIRVCTGYLCTGDYSSKIDTVLYSVFQVCIFKMSPLPYRMLQLGHPLIRLSMRACAQSLQKMCPHVLSTTSLRFF